ncbi:unnamed protein product [Prunus armeniaca]|uniref:Bromo domain-containing protein n=1 Tax=Prunus armeniaca TaxID=36596 RepID=A0A6J5X704_PRUAR|nr:unnamed protein product [Prunus armeniaca]
MASSSRNRKRKQLGDGVAPFEFRFQTQKRERSSRVLESQRIVAVDEKTTASLPLRKGFSPKQGNIIPLASSARKRRQSDELGWYFEKPAENLPGYSHDIWRPMDFGTVKSKLERGVYSSADGFAADVRLTLSNALRYYPHGRIEHAAAKHLSGVFESKWKEAVEKNPKSFCLPPLPKVKGLAASPKLKQARPLLLLAFFEVNGLRFLILSQLIQPNMMTCPPLLIMPWIRLERIFLHGVPDSPPRRKSMHRMKQRESAPRTISNMEKSVQFEDPLQDLKQLEMLCSCGSEEVNLGLPLKKLGVYLKQDDELQGQDEEAFLNGD